MYFFVFLTFEVNVLGKPADDVHAHTRDICSTVVTHDRNHIISNKNEIYYFDNAEVGIPYESLPQMFNVGETYEQADIRSKEQYLKEVPLIAASYHYRCGPHTYNILGHINDFEGDIYSDPTGNNKGCKPGYYCTIEIQIVGEGACGIGDYDYCEVLPVDPSDPLTISNSRRWKAVPVCKIVEAGYYAPGRLALKEPTFDDLNALDSEDGISLNAFQMGYPYVDFNTISSDPLLMSESEFNTWTQHYQHCYDNCECKRNFVPVDQAVQLWGFEMYQMERKKGIEFLEGVYTCDKCDFNLFTDRSWAFNEATSDLNVGDFVYGKCKGACCRHNKIGSNCDGSIGTDHFNHICVPEKIENICSPKYKCPEGTISVEGASYCTQNLFANHEWDANTQVTRSHFTEQDLEADEPSEISSPCRSDTQSSIINIVNRLGDISYDYNSISLPRRYQNMHYQLELEVNDVLGTYNGNPTTVYKSIIRSAVMWTAYKEENIDAGSFKLQATPFFLPGKLSSSKLPFTNTWHCVSCPEAQHSKGSEHRCCDLQSEWNTALERCVVACPLNFKIECQSSRRHHRADESEGHGGSSEIATSADAGCTCTACPYGYYVHWDKLSCISCGEISGAGRRPVTNEQMQCVNCANNEYWSPVEVRGRNVLSSGSCVPCTENMYKNPLVWNECIGCPLMLNENGDLVQSQRSGNEEYCTAPNVPGQQRIQPVPDNAGDPIVEEWCPDGFEKAHSTYCVSCALGKTRKLILGYHYKKDPACIEACPLLEYPIYNLEGCAYCDAGSAPLITKETAYIFSPFSYSDATAPDWYNSGSSDDLKCAKALDGAWDEPEFNRFDLEWLNNLMRVNCYEYYPSKSGPRTNKLQGPICSGRNKIISGSQCSVCPAGTYASLTDNFCTPCSTGLSCEMDQGCTSSSDCSACPGGKYIAFDFLTANDYKFMDPEYEGLLVRPPKIEYGRSNSFPYVYEFRTGRECSGGDMLQSNIIPDIECDWGLGIRNQKNCEEARVGRSDGAHRIQGYGSVVGDRWGDYSSLNISEGNYMEMSHNAYSKFLIAQWGQWTRSDGSMPKGQKWEEFTHAENTDYHVGLAVYGVHAAHRKCSDKVEFQVILNTRCETRVIANYNDNFCDTFLEDAHECPCPDGLIRNYESSYTDACNCDNGQFFYIGRYGRYCRDCTNGKYNDITNKRSRACKACDEGKYHKQRKSTSELDCEVCGTGEVWVFGAITDINYLGHCIDCNVPATCEPCAAGKYKQLDENGIGTTCQNCPAGKFSATSAVENSYSDIQTPPCTQCSSGKYQSNSGESFCEDCPINTFSDQTGRDSVMDCSFCLSGTYTSITGSSSCLDCEKGKKSIFKDLSAIYLEAYSVPCVKGYTIHGELCSWNECEMCEAGKYSLIERSTDCLSCPENKYSTIIGSELASDCNDCPAGKSTDGNLGQGSCSDCPGGKFSNIGGDCQDCPASEISSPGSSSCTPCSGGKFPFQNVCTNCQAGKFSESGAIECTPCVQGRFSDAGASFCLGCDEGKGFPLDVQDIESWDGICELCTKGKAVENDHNSDIFSFLGSEMYPICSDCRAGKFSDVDGSTSCERCERGKFSESAVSVCTDCAIGEFTRSVLGGSPVGTCLACTTHWHWWNDIQAPEGKFIGSVAGQKVCCEKGSQYYDSTSGLCVECPRNKISSDGTSCTECPEDQIRHDSWDASGDSPQCTACPHGSKRSTGKLECHHPDCSGDDDWYYSSGSIICDGCAHGMFSDDTYSNKNGYHNDEDPSWMAPILARVGPLVQTNLIPTGQKIPGLAWLRTANEKCRPAPPGFYSAEKDGGNKICSDGEYPDYPILSQHTSGDEFEGIFSLIQSGSFNHEEYRSFMDLKPYFNHNDGIPDEETINKLARKISFVGASSCKKCPIGTFVSVKYIESRFGSQYDGGDTLDSDEFELMIKERWTCYPCPANKICDPNVELCRIEADCHECEDKFFVEQALIELGEAYTKTGNFENDVAFVGKMKDGKLKEDSWTVFYHELQGGLEGTTTIGNSNEIRYGYVLKYNPRVDVQCSKLSSDFLSLGDGLGAQHPTLCSAYSTVIETLGFKGMCRCNDHQYPNEFGTCINCELGHERIDSISETCTACPVGKYFDYGYLNGDTLIQDSDRCARHHSLFSKPYFDAVACVDSSELGHKICPAFGDRYYHGINIPASASCKLCPDGFYSDTPAAYGSKYTFDMNFCTYIDTNLALETDNYHYLCYWPPGQGDTRCLTYRNYEGSCKMCPIGKISDVDRQDCTADMDANKKYLYKTYTHNNGIYDSSKPISEYETGIIFTEDAQIVCEVGYELDKSNACQPCPTGEFREDEAASRCMPCTSLESNSDKSCGDSATRINCQGADIGTCQCDSGGVFNQLDKSCINCALGKYLLGENCVECDTGTESSGLRNSCSACAAGKVRSLGMNQCSDCGPGEDQVLSGRDACTRCSAGYYKLNAGSELCNPCTCAGNLEYVSNCDSVEGATCTQCTASECEGHQYISGCEEDGTPICSSCVSCEEGFENVACSLTNEGECTACTTGKYSEEEISFECATCPVCGPQKFRYEVCGGSDIGQCQDCPDNTAKTTFSNTDFCQDCQMCTAGEYNKCCGSWCENFKLDDLNPCDSNCPSSGTAAEVCIACPSGSFKNEAAHGECIGCADCEDIGNYKIGCMQNFEGICEPIPSGAIHTDEIANFDSGDDTAQIQIRIVYSKLHQQDSYINFELHQYAYNREIKDENSVNIGNINTDSAACSSCDATLAENGDIPDTHNCIICIFEDLIDGIYRLLHKPTTVVTVDHTIEVIKNKNLPIESRLISQSALNEADFRFDLSSTNYVPYTFCGVNEVTNIDKSACISCDFSTAGSSAPRPILNDAKTAEISPVFWPMLYSENSWDFHKCYCAAGYSPTGSNGECMECQMNEYSSQGQLQCSACIHSSHILTAQINSDSCLCNPGYEPALTDPHTCNPCQAGFYKGSTGNSVCLICPLGSYCEGSTGTNPGTIIPKECEVGFYCPEGSATAISCNTYIPFSTTALTGQGSTSNCICQTGYVFYVGSDGSSQCIVSSTDCGVDMYKNFYHGDVIQCNAANDLPEFNYDSSLDIQNKFDIASEQNTKVDFMTRTKVLTDVLITSKTSFRVIFKKDSFLQNLHNPTFDHYRLSKKNGDQDSDGNLVSFEYKRPQTDEVRIGTTSYYYFDFTEQDFTDNPVTGGNWKSEYDKLEITMWPYTADNEAIPTMDAIVWDLFSRPRYIWLPQLDDIPQLYSCASSVSQCDSQLNYFGNLFCFDSCEDSCNLLRHPRSFKINSIDKQDSHSVDVSGQDLHIRGYIIQATRSGCPYLLHRQILKIDENNECDFGISNANYAELPLIEQDVSVWVRPYDAFQIGTSYSENLVLPVLNKICEECPEFSTSIPASDELTDCRCNAGFTGTVDSSEGCVACESGKFKEQNGHASCSECAVGMQSAIASTSSFDCILENAQEVPFPWPNFTDVADASKNVHPLVLCNDYDSAIQKSTLPPRSPPGDAPASVGGCVSISYDVACAGGASAKFISYDESRPEVPYLYFYNDLIIISTGGDSVYFEGILMDTETSAPASFQNYGSEFEAANDAEASQVCGILCTDYGTDCKGYATYHGFSALLFDNDDYVCYIFTTNSASEERNSNSEVNADDLVLNDWQQCIELTGDTETFWDSDETFFSSDTDFYDITPDYQSYAPHWNFYKKNCEAAPEVEPEPPTAFYEANCVAINPCAETSHRANGAHSIPKEIWTHRSEENTLQFPSEMGVTDKIINYFGFEYARIPLGVTLRTCAPNFDKLRNEGVYECNLETMKTIVGTCSLSKVAQNSIFTFDCVQSVQFDAEEDSSYVPNALLPGSKRYTSSTFGTTQMLYYDISDDYTCDDISTPQGSKLEQTDYYPAKIVTCESPPRENAVYSSDCSFTCNSPYLLDESGPNPTCVNQCDGYTQEPCADDEGIDVEDANARCLFDSSFFKCVKCYAIDRHEVDLVKNLVTDECTWKLCDAGYVQPTFVMAPCTPCPINTKEDVAGATETCLPCDLANGEYTTNTAQTSCTICFSTDIASISCESGRKLYSQLELINNFYNDNGLAMDENEIIPYKMREWCEIGYVCLPCPPGTFESSGECEACPDDEYQNNYGHTSCYACPVNQKTLTTGAKEISDCKCTHGYEFSSV